MQATEVVDVVTASAPNNAVALSRDSWSTIVRLGGAWAAAAAAADVEAETSTTPTSQRRGRRRSFNKNILNSNNDDDMNDTTIINGAEGGGVVGRKGGVAKKKKTKKKNAAIAAMREKIQTIMDQQTESLDDPAPLVLFALRQRPDDTPLALDALDAVQSEKADEVETTCTQHYSDFARAMGDLESIRDGMSTLGREATAHNDELQAVGRPLLRSLETLRDCRVANKRVEAATDAVASCQAALEVAAAARDCLRRGDLLHALRHVETLEMHHLPFLPCSALATHLMRSTGPARDAVARAADVRATDWLVSARTVARDVGMREMAAAAAEAAAEAGDKGERGGEKENNGGTERSPPPPGPGRGVAAWTTTVAGDHIITNDDDKVVSVNVRRRRRSVAAAVRARDTANVRKVVAESVAATRAAVAAATAKSKQQQQKQQSQQSQQSQRGGMSVSSSIATFAERSQTQRGGLVVASTSGGEVGGDANGVGGGGIGIGGGGEREDGSILHSRRSSLGSNVDGSRGPTPTKRRIDFTAAIAGLPDQGGAGTATPASSGVDRRESGEWAATTATGVGGGDKGDGGGGGGGNDDENHHLSGFTLGPLLQCGAVFEAMGRGQAFAARIRRERALQLKADLSISGGGGSGISGRGEDNNPNADGGGGLGTPSSSTAGDGFLRRLVNDKLEKFVGFFVVQERLSRAIPTVLPTRESIDVCAEACRDLGMKTKSACERAKDPAVLLATYDATSLACAALRRRDFVPTGLEAATSAAAGRYVELLGAAVSAGIAPGATLERLNPIAGGREGHSVVAGEIADVMGAFAFDAGAFIGQLRGGGGGGGSGSGGGLRGAAVAASAAAKEAAEKVRSCVEKLALELVQPMVRLQGFKESHAMQLVSDADHLNTLAKKWEEEAATAAASAATKASASAEEEEDYDYTSATSSSSATVAAAAGDDVIADSWRLCGWAPFDELARLATDSLEKCVASRVSELLVSSNAASDWAPDSPPANQLSETAASTQVYLDGTLRFAALVLPPAAATRLARSALRVAADAMLAPLDTSAVKKFTAFGVAVLEQDTASLEALADSIQAELGGGGFGGGVWANSGLRDALTAPRAFVRLLTGGDHDVVPMADEASVMDPARMSAAGLPLDKFARMLDKYKEVSTASKLMMQMRGDGGKLPTKKQVEAAAKAMRLRAAQKI